MTDVYTIFGGDMWRQVFNGVVTIIGADTFTTMKRIAVTFSVLIVMMAWVKGRDPRVFFYWLALFFFITAGLLAPKRSVQIIDLTDSASVYQVDNVPAGLAMIAGLGTGGGYGAAQLYEYTLSRPDSLTYTKSGMLFGSQIVAQSSDMRTQNPVLAQMLTDYVENCVIGDILLNQKYTVNDLLNSTDPLTLITNNPSPLRGLYRSTSSGREFVTCQQGATEIKTLMADDIRVGGTSWHDLATRLFGSKVTADTLLANAMNDSYGFFYAGGLSAAQIMRNNVTNAAIRDGWKGFAARSNDTANLVNLATESSLTKQRLSWAAGGAIAARTLPMFHSLMMLVLIGLFPLVIVLALTSHSMFGLNTIKIYACGFLYFQMWPVMFAILNSLANFYLQSKTGTTALVLANADRVALQHSDVANIAGYLSMSIPVLSFFLTKGAASVASQVVGGIMSSAAFATGGQASTTADGNWSFNNMSMDNLNANKFDSNLVHRQGQQSRQLDNGAMRTETSAGGDVYDTSGAISVLPVSMRLSALASSGFNEQSRLAAQHAQTALDGYNQSVTSGYQQLNQLSRQSGNSDTFTKGSDSSQATNATRGTSMMQSAVESYAKSNHLSQAEAYNALMSKASDLSANAGTNGKFDTGSTVWGGAFKGATGLSAEAHVGVEMKGSTGSQHGTNESNSSGVDHRNDKSSQAVNDFRQGMDMVTSSRLSESGSHSDNQSNSRVEQFAATLNDSKSQYQQFTDSTTRSREFSRMATLAENQSASLDSNYNQEFVNWTTAKYGHKAQDILTNVSSARSAATEFMEEHMKPEIMSNYRKETAFAGNAPLRPSEVGEELLRRGEMYQQGGGVHFPSGTAYRSSGGRVGQDIADDFRNGQGRITEEARGAGIPSDVQNQVAAQRSDNAKTISDNDGKIDQNKTTVQASSDILKGQHDSAQRNFATGYENEKSRQKLLPDEADEKSIKAKIEELRKKAG